MFTGHDHGHPCLGPVGFRAKSSTLTFSPSVLGEIDPFGALTSVSVPSWLVGFEIVFLSSLGFSISTNCLKNIILFFFSQNRIIFVVTNQFFATFEIFMNRLMNRYAVNRYVLLFLLINFPKLAKRTIKFGDSLLSL